MAECSNGASQQAAEINVLNSKLGYDAAAQIQNQGLLDNQSDSRAWNELKLTEARDAGTIKYLASVAALATDQTGQTENQQTTSPIRSGAGDAIAAVPGVAAGQVSANIADLATGLVPAITNSVNSAWAQAWETFVAGLPTLVTAMGGASTPSQTKPPTTA